MLNIGAFLFVNPYLCQSLSGGSTAGFKPRQKRGFSFCTKKPEQLALPGLNGWDGLY
jgi:hypothetical protein